MITMPVISSQPDSLHKDAKVFGKHRWKDKLFASDRRLFSRTAQDKESSQQDVASFLGSTPPDHTTQSSYISSTPPRIDAPSASQYVVDEPIPSPPPPLNIYHRAKPRQNKGLRVTFVFSPPELIGDGGDDAESPPISISQRRQQGPIITIPYRTRGDTLASTSSGGSDRAPASQDNQFLKPATEKQERAQRLSRLSIDFGDIHPKAIGDAAALQDEEYSPVSPLDDEDSPKGYDSGLPLPDRSQAFDGSVPSPLVPPHTYLSEDRGRSSPSPPYDPPFDASGRFTPSPVPPAQRYDDVDEALSRQTSKTESTNSRPDEKISNGDSVKSLTPSAPKQLSLKSVAKGLGEDAVNDFELRVHRFNDIFRLGNPSHGDSQQTSFGTWVALAGWWFLRGRTELEAAVRSRNQRHQADGQNIPITLKQAYLDLAKAWWILRDVAPQHPEITRYGNASMESMVAITKSVGDQQLAELIESHITLVSKMRALFISMKRNNRLPPEDMEIQRLDLHVLPRPVRFPDELRNILQNFHEQGHSSFMPSGDTQLDFTFGTMFGGGSIVSRTRAWETVHITCAITLFRARNNLEVKASIVSLEGGLSLVLGEGALPWGNVNWSSSGNFISFALASNVDFSVQLSPGDFKNVWNICDYIRKVQKDFEGRKGEEVVFETELAGFQCLQSTRANSFSKEAIKKCHVRLFARFLTANSGTGRVNAGFRLMIRTAAGSKTLSSISQDYGDDMPTVFGFGRRQEQPRLVVRVPDSCVFVLSFATWDEMDLFYNQFTQRQPCAEERRSAPLSLVSLELKTEDKSVQQSMTHLAGTKWQSIKVVKQLDPPAHARPHQVSVEHQTHTSRIIAQSDRGILTDHINLPPGELQLALSVENCNAVSLSRPAQRDIFASLTDHALPESTVAQWRALLYAAPRSHVTKAFTFRNLADLHTFETLITGFDVAYEGVATSYSIARRMKGVPLSKHWDTDFARLQILRRGAVTQLLAFFRGAGWGECMNFVLKSTDEYESYAKSDGSMYYVRLCDAKFALPKKEGGGYVSVDNPAFATEHDDVVVGFRDVNYRDRFAAQLPGTVGKASRMDFLKR